jgi:cytoskeletal protein RodZ
MSRLIISILFTTLILSSASLFSVLIINDHITTQNGTFTKEIGDVQTKVKSIESRLDNIEGVISSLNSDDTTSLQSFFPTKKEDTTSPASSATTKEDTTTKVDTKTQTKDSNDVVVEKPKEDKKVATKPKQTNVLVKANGLNFRANPSTGSKVIRVLPSGESLTILNETKTSGGYKWIKVRDYKGNTGWVADDFLK